MSRYFVNCHTVGTVVREERRISMHGALYGGLLIFLQECIMLLDNVFFHYRFTTEELILN